MIARITEAIRNYKVGVTEDPWLQIPRSRIRDGERFIKDRVKGQDHAVVLVTLNGRTAQMSDRAAFRPGCEQLQVKRAHVSRWHLRQTKVPAAVPAA
jgi:ATP-dependent Clp protease ATP-binding subunit ClpA